jgi:glycerate kinase
VRVLIAPCSFKESLTAKSAAEVLARVVRAHGHTPDLAPIADGGEGTLEILKAPLGLRLRTARVPGAMGGLVRARFGVGDELVVLEAAEAIGLAQVPRHLRRPLDASSLGFGRLLVRALELQPQRVLVGLGGSATVDGGAGLLAALGVRFLDARGRELMPTPRALTRLARVDKSGLDPRVARTELTVLTDVRSPLLGPRGAELYMAQKGVRPAELPALRALLRRLHPGASARVPGAGAAGGLGAALHSVGARLVPGIDVVLEAQARAHCRERPRHHRRGPPRPADPRGQGARGPGAGVSPGEEAAPGAVRPRGAAARRTSQGRRHRPVRGAGPLHGGGGRP